MAFELTKEQLAALLGPLSQSRVSQRSQSGRQLSYLEAWDVRATLTRVFGFGNWDAEILSARIVYQEQVDKVKDGVVQIEITNLEGAERKDVKKDWIIAYEATVQLTVRDGRGASARFTETAVASQKGPDIGEVGDFAIKTAESDALKRAAMNLGTQFGLSLYDNGSLSDVIRVVLEPSQAVLLAEIREEQAKKAAESGKAPSGQSADAVMRRADTAEAAALVANELGGSPVDADPADPNSGRGA